MTQGHIIDIKLKISGKIQVTCRLTQQKTIAVHPHQQVRTFSCFSDLLLSILFDLPLGTGEHLFPHLALTLLLTQAHINYLII